MFSYLFRRSSAEQRRYSRCETWLRAVIGIPGAFGAIHGAIRNFSPRGCLFLPQDAPLFLRSDKLELRVNGLIIAANLLRRSKHGLHMQFEKPQTLPWPKHCDKCTQTCRERNPKQMQED